jgi:hypothetical protein
MLSLYSIFHINLAYSSIPISKRRDVIRKCFWPLTKLARNEGIPIAITAPAYTIEVANELDPQWVAGLRELVHSGSIEFIGAGYSQLIGPLVPSEVNSWNLEIGNDLYEKYLDVKPRLWYVNEQAYSSSLVDHYRQIGADAIVMEWNNPRTYHQEWKEEYRYFPQVAVGCSGATIPLIWNDSITFQKFQRMTHGDIEAGELLEYLAPHSTSVNRNFCLYGNDAEIFDFRPGRFKTEPELGSLSEWQRITLFYRLLKSDSRFALIHPSAVLKSNSEAVSRMPLSLECPSFPIPVKKQPKYNITRWAATGRDSIRINSDCYRIYSQLKSAFERGCVPLDRISQYKKELCYLWSSDFRTHIVPERWKKFLGRIESVAAEVNRLNHPSPHNGRSTILDFSVNGLNGSVAVCDTFTFHKLDVQHARDGQSGYVRQNDRSLEFETPAVRMAFDVRRGLAVKRIVFPGLSEAAVAGWVPHGYYTDIALSADWYTGNSVLQRPGMSQLTDLAPARVSFVEGECTLGEWVGCKGDIRTELGDVRKVIRVYKDRPQVDFEFEFVWSEIPAGSFKTGFLTLIPTSYDLDTLFYATHNGGDQFEVFPMKGAVIEHDAPSSSVVTASTGLGATKGAVVMGDREKGILFYFDQRRCAAMPMIKFSQTPPSYFGRMNLSCGEMDESRTQPVPGPMKIAFSLAGMSAGQTLDEGVHRRGIA